jgi:hypothetical protein
MKNQHEFCAERRIKVKNIILTLISRNCNLSTIVNIAVENRGDDFDERFVYFIRVLKS